MENRVKILPDGEKSGGNSQREVCPAMGIDGTGVRGYSSGQRFLRRNRLRLNNLRNR
jgi:hypothetical protein